MTFAFSKGINYGTAIVDLEQHRIVDLLPDREAQTVENWFKARPEVTIVTRDRFSRYAAGVTNALPEATQMAYRWDLLKNIGDALQKLLERKLENLRKVAGDVNTLQERVRQLEQQQLQLGKQVEELTQIRNVLQRDPALIRVAKVA